MKTYLETQIYLNLTVIAILFPKKKESRRKADDRADGLSHKEINCSALEDLGKVMSNPQNAEKLELVVFAMCKLLDICKYPHSGMVNWEQPSGCLATFFIF